MYSPNERAIIARVLDNLHPYKSKGKCIRGRFEALGVPVIFFPSTALIIIPCVSTHKFSREMLNTISSVLYSTDPSEISFTHERQVCERIYIAEAYFAIVDCDMNVFYVQISQV